MLYDSLRGARIDDFSRGTYAKVANILRSVGVKVFSS